MSARKSKSSSDTDSNAKKVLKDHSKELRELMGDFRSQISELASSLRDSMERHALETASVVRTAADFVARSEITISDLTSQVAGLRDYLAKQQQTLIRFQDGYDWTIMKNFSSRIIRCIDHIESRMEQVRENGGESLNDLEDIHDQLVFALDGSGIEQFKPEEGAPYSGLEKIAEVVGKDPGGEPGCISRVVAPGYRFYVNEELSRLVRPARVRLFNDEPEGSE